MRPCPADSSSAWPPLSRWHCSRSPFGHATSFTRLNETCFAAPFMLAWRETKWRRRWAIPARIWLQAPVCPPGEAHRLGALTQKRGSISSSQRANTALCWHLTKTGLRRSNTEVIEIVAQRPGRSSASEPCSGWRWSWRRSWAGWPSRSLGKKVSPRNGFAIKLRRADSSAEYPP